MYHEVSWMTKGRAANSYNCDASLCIITTKHKGQHTHTHTDNRHKSILKWGAPVLCGRPVVLPCILHDWFHLKISWGVSLFSSVGYLLKSLRRCTLIQVLIVVRKLRSEITLFQPWPLKNKQKWLIGRIGQFWRSILNLTQNKFTLLSLFDEL